MIEDKSEFMVPRFDNVCQICKSQFKDQKNTMIRKTVIQIFPNLARFNKEKFALFFPEISGYLISGLKKDKEVSLLAIGQIATVPSLLYVKEEYFFALLSQT